MKNGETPRGLTLRGIVVPTEWSSRGEVLRVAILTPDEDEYDVSENGVGTGLLGVLREEVEARVLFDVDQGNRQRVTVLSYTVLDANDDDYILDDLLNEPDRGGW